MRRLIFICSFLLLPWAAIAADEPFSPTPDVVDYVATFISAEKIPERRTVHHHGAWSRIERTQGDDRTTMYSNDAIPLLITVNPASSEYPRLTIEAGRPRLLDFGLHEHPFKLRQHDTVLGEPCDVWRLGDDLHSCVTTDGIELWKEPYDRTATTKAVALERRTVAESDVLPPADIFNWTTWSGPVSDSVSGTKADATVTMEATGENPAQRTTRTITRRHHPWSTYESFEGEVRRRLLINNKTTGVALRVDTNSDGKLVRLWALKMREGSTGRQPTPLVRLKKRPKETVLGEDCTWFLVKSGAEHERHTECNTKDGLVLKRVIEERGKITLALTATRIERTPLSLADVSPPPSVLDPKNWGITDLAPRQ